ncbi:Protein transport protein SSO2 [Lasiodiplodia hormozganensis]|uniref:Protein transport protein SSO2 n=1 Tax=Lasiodiplodia hormozganensis TaxID=869390 RepID=A0AA39XRB6_9PEZI|nr:Snare domain-containing protein [Lasiodiplodia theobromae]KAF4541831.1 Snare domain-containing protein [Lasiodiplodia theobromae]KAK0638276.1 Protein transport protein SSO2 [Lasiodiplodia hormozganensis]
MASQYGGYGQGGYGGQNPYGGNDGGYGDKNGYSNPFTEPDYEMQAMNNGGFAQQAADPNAILNDCQAIDRALDQIDSQLEQLTRLHKSAVNEPLVYKNQIDNLNNEIMTGYRGLVDRMRRIKGMPESGEPRNKPQVGRVDRRLKSTINKFQEVESKFRKELQESQARQYRIVRPDATDDEVKQAVEDPNAQIFQQAMLQSDRRGQAQSALRAVEGRHKEIQKIEQQMVELAQLFQDLNEIVVQQEPLVENIEQKGEEVRDNVVKANEEIAVAIDSARARNRKKWYCLGLVILILVIIAIIVAVVVVMNQNK